MVRLFRVLAHPRYAGIALLASLTMFALYTYTQVLGIIENLGVWFASVPPLNLALTMLFSLLFGVTLSYQISLWKKPGTCSTNERMVGTGTTGFGTMGTFLVAQCPACASLGALFLPLSAINFLATYGTYITLASIVLLVFTLNYLGAFKNE
mgnify:FL=1